MYYLGHEIFAEVDVVAIVDIETDKKDNVKLVRVIDTGDILPEKVLNYRVTDPSSALFLAFKPTLKSAKQLIKERVANAISNA